MLYMFFVYIDVICIVKTKRPLFPVARFFHASCLLETNVFYNACKEGNGQRLWIRACMHARIYAV
jgi:hypothetical protein